jgi:hypothetical protein
MALPRSGNTLFASIINQNPKVACTANSITLDIYERFILAKTDLTYLKTIQITNLWIMS